MDARNSLWATAVFLVAVVLITPVAIYSLFRSDSPSDELASTPSSGSSSLGSAGPRGAGASAGAGEAFATPPQQEEAEKLQSLIDSKNEQLARQREQLKAKEAAYQKLRSDYDDTLRFMEELLGEEPADAGESPEADGGESGEETALAPLVRSREELEVELRRLRQQRDAAQEKETMLSAELEQLREQASVEMTAAQLALDEERLLRDIASRALVESGEGALPVIVLMLRDERPRIRAWAADVLGGMGPRAGDALMPLSELATGDPDQRVREAAQQALRAIRD